MLQISTYETRSFTHTLLHEKSWNCVENKRLGSVYAQNEIVVRIITLTDYIFLCYEHIKIYITLIIMIKNGVIDWRYRMSEFKCGAMPPALFNLKIFVIWHFIVTWNICIFITFLITSLYYQTKTLHYIIYDFNQGHAY